MIRTKGELIFNEPVLHAFASSLISPFFTDVSYLLCIVYDRIINYRGNLLIPYQKLQYKAYRRHNRTLCTTTKLVCKLQYHLVIELGREKGAVCNSRHVS